MKRNQHQVTSKSSRPIAAPQPKTAHSRTPTRPARPAGADCDTLPVYSDGSNGCVERDLDGRLFFVEREKLPGCGWPWRDVSRREIGYPEALAFIGNHS